MEQLAFRHWDVRAGTLLPNMLNFTACSLYQDKANAEASKESTVQQERQEVWEILLQKPNNPHLKWVAKSEGQATTKEEKLEGC